MTAHVGGDKLLSLDDTEIQRIAPDLKKKIGRRKKFMARVQPLRMGFLAWNVDDAVRWLEVHNLREDMEMVFREARASPMMICCWSDLALPLVGWRSKQSTAIALNPSMLLR